MDYEANDDHHHQQEQEDGTKDSEEVVTDFKPIVHWIRVGSEIVLHTGKY